ncbi:hypothetical protein [Leucobacter musarum]|uniref:hypothetical protein n=1 Tax=Leucobacter musarum TaxID=1930747 RepID=UPI000AF1F27B|nr:hypothetical protein [Leucobacter musarum]
MKHPLKLARKEFPRYGAVLIEEHPRGGQTWRMPWGERWVALPSIRLATVRARLAELRERRDPLHGFEPAPVPMGLEFAGSGHFTDRFMLMASQHGELTYAEVRAAMLEPTETRVHWESHRCAYIRDRVAVIATRDGAGMRLITVLWTRPDLWAQNPREEKETNHV